MAKELIEDFSESNDVIDIAIGLLGCDVAQRCFHGPAERLNLTKETQPAILATRCSSATSFLL